MGNDISCNNSIDMNATSIKMYLSSLPAHWKLLNFNAINFKGAISKKENKTTKPIITGNESHVTPRNNKDEIKRAFAGVGNPINESL